MDTPWLLLLILPAFLLFFGLMWTGIVYVTAKVAGLERTLAHVQTGALLRSSRYGSARIRGMNFQNSLKVLEYEAGYMLQLMPIFGGFKRWLPKDELEIEPLSRAFIGSRRTVISNGRKIHLYGTLAKFVEPDRAD